MKVRKWLIWLLTVVLMFSMTACGANVKAESDNAYYVNGGAEAGDQLVAEAPAQAEALPENRKLIRTLRMEAETEDLDALIAALDSKTTELGGYVEGRDVYNGSTYSQRRYRNASMTIRIPAGSLRGFTEHVEGLSNVVSSNESIDDITLQYVDTESRVAALEVEQERLLALMEKAETLYDLLEIERRLTEVRYQLENYASQLRSYDNKVDYATVHLSITEVTEYTPVEEETIWQRISGGFVGNLKKLGNGLVELGIWLVVNLPFLAVFGVMTWGIIWVTLWAVKKSKKTVPPEKTE